MNVLALLSLATSILQGTPNAAAVARAGQIIQLVTQAVEAPGLVGTHDVRTTDYLAATGGWTTAGNGLEVLADTASFGDLNRDGTKDAAVIVKRTRMDGSAEFDLAVLLDEGEGFFNIGDTPVGNNPKVFSREITGGEIVIDMEADNAQRAVSKYELLGNALIKRQ